jgi:hypothetical protein
VVERLFRAGLGACALGRVPMGATPELVGALPPWRGGDPPGEDVDVRLDCWAADSNKLKLLVGLEDGDEVLLARERCCPGA